MPKRSTGSTQAPASAKRSAGKTKETRDAARESTLVEQMLDAAMAKLADKDVSVGDFLRLLQARRDMESDQIKEIEVRWVDASETVSADKP